MTRAMLGTAGDGIGKTARLAEDVSGAQRLAATQL